MYYYLSSRKCFGFCWNIKSSIINVGLVWLFSAGWALGLSLFHTLVLRVEIIAQWYTFQLGYRPKNIWVCILRDVQYLHCTFTGTQYVCIVYTVWIRKLFCSKVRWASKISKFIIFTLLSLNIGRFEFHLTRGICFSK